MRCCPGHGSPPVCVRSSVEGEGAAYQAVITQLPQAVHRLQGKSSVGEGEVCDA